MTMIIAIIIRQGPCSIMNLKINDLEKKDALITPRFQYNLGVFYKLNSAYLEICGPV